MNLRCLHLFSLFTVLYLVNASLFPAIARTQEQEEVKGAPAEPADAKEVREQIALVQKLQPTLKDKGAALYFLAWAKQHLREDREALGLLKQCLALQEGFDPSGEPAFYGLKGTKEFTALVDAVHKDFPIVAQAHEAFRTTEKNLIPEGLAYDPQRKVFYMSSLNRRKIVEIGPDGNTTDFVPADRFGLLPVLGIRPSPTDETVWADSYTESGQTELLHFDSSGKLLGRFKPGDAEKHGFNDLVVRKSGKVITTDTLANKVFEYDPAAGVFTAMHLHRDVSYPNGIALSGDGNLLYVADNLGVVALNLASGESQDVEPGAKTTLAGIDGLYWYNGSLIGVQNGIGSPRIAMFHLSSDGLRVTRTTVLENRTNFTVLPTTGAIRGSDFYFMANSQVDNLNNDKVMDVTKLEVIRVAVVHLP